MAVSQNGVRRTFSHRQGDLEVKRIYGIIQATICDKRYATKMLHSAQNDLSYLDPYPILDTMKVRFLDRAPSAEIIP